MRRVLDGIDRPPEAIPSSLAHLDEGDLMLGVLSTHSTKLDSQIN